MALFFCEQAVAGYLLSGFAETLLVSLPTTGTLENHRNCYNKLL